jgi:flagellar hook assembly protein FlgD
MEYSSDSEPPAIDYSNIYAYPNPVRPEYTGDITIRGLMENSLVKIADSAGNVVKSVRSSGGMATWDGCNYQGEPVKSGVYFILASQNENESSSGAVSKILIIR